jgi:hypothetical protein
MGVSPPSAPGAGGPHPTPTQSPPSAGCLPARGLSSSALWPATAFLCPGGTSSPILRHAAFLCPGAAPSCATSLLAPNHTRGAPLCSPAGPGAARCDCPRRNCPRSCPSRGPARAGGRPFGYRGYRRIRCCRVCWRSAPHAAAAAGALAPCRSASPSGAAVAVGPICSTHRRQNCPTFSPYATTCVKVGPRHPCWPALPPLPGPAVATPPPLGAAAAPLLGATTTPLTGGLASASAPPYGWRCSPLVVSSCGRWCLCSPWRLCYLRHLGQKDLFHSPHPLKGSLVHIYRLPTKRSLVAKHRG